LFRWKWERDDRYTTEFTHDDADEVITLFDWERQYADDTLLDFLRPLRRLFNYRAARRSQEPDDWESPIELTQSAGSIRDHFHEDEMQRLYDVAIGYNTVGHYDACTPEERDRVRSILAQRFGKPKSSVTKAGFKRANSWKVPSLVAVSLDVGFQPIEVERARTSWFDPVRGGRRELHIPKEDSSKNEGVWRPVLSERAAKAVLNWPEERERYDKYQGNYGIRLTKGRECGHVLDRLQRAVRGRMTPIIGITPPTRLPTPKSRHARPS